jgi:acyl-CoA oxidase
MKYWIGALAEVANVTILWAQLIINEKSEGPHPFYLPIRCPKTHKVLPGITIGDCGPKKGVNGIDNGYMILEDVRIPHSWLLGKYGSVDKTGAYSSPFSDRNMRFGLHMSALSAGRAYLAFTTNVINAATIALRYAHSRKQFETPDKTDEVTIIDYPLTQIRIIP